MDAEENSDSTTMIMGRKLPAAFAKQFNKDVKNFVFKFISLS